MTAAAPGCYNHRTAGPENTIVVSVALATSSKNPGRL